jgi:F-type H+-transporting ATPase subunit delta
MDLAQEQAVLENVARDLHDLAGMIRSSQDLALLIRSPLTGAARQEKALGALAEKAGFGALTRNFIGVLAQNRRLGALEDIIRAFEGELARRRGEVTAEVRTVQDLTPAQHKALAAALSRSAGSNVVLKASVDPDILGGMIVTIGSRMIDDSTRRKLERLKAAMKSGSGQNNTLTTKQAKGV